MSYLSDLLGEAYKEGMTVEEISTALETINTNQPDTEALKRQLSKANAEAAKYKNQLKDKLTADERAKAEHDEALEAAQSINEELREQVASLTKTINLSTNKDKFVAMGYKPELATRAAQAVVDGNMDALLTIQKEFVDAHDSDLKSELMKGMSKPASGSTDTTMTKDTLMKMSREERIAWAMKEENQAQYQTLMNGE